MFRGHGELDGVIDALAPFEQTLHEVSSMVFELGPAEDRGVGEATGECALAAHHVRGGAAPEEGGEAGRRDASDLVLYGRYLDRFRRDDDGTWRFAARELRVLWSEKRSVRVG